MAYGDYNGPDKPNKGHEGGACNRQRCQAEPALWFNHGMSKWYCGDCKRDIGEDHINAMGWRFSESYPGHPQFETREQMDKRKAEADAKKAAEPPAPPRYEDFFHRPLGKAKSSSLERMLKKGRR